MKEKNKLALFKRIADHGIKLELKQGSLFLRSETSDLDQDLLNEIKENKSEIIKYLQEAEKAGTGNFERIKKHAGSGERMPLSFSQEGLWFIDKLQGSVQYHIPTLLKLAGRVDRELLQRVLRKIVDRHEILRTVIKEEDGLGYQDVKPSSAWTLDYQDATGENDLAQKVSAALSVPFDLSSDFMMRACLYRLGEQEHVLAVVFHHIASDEWSGRILVKEFAELYSSYQKGEATGPEPLELQYKDYAAWQRTHISGDYLEGQLNYWEKKLTGLAPLELPMDYTRPPVQSTRGAFASFSLDKQLSDRLYRLCSEEGVTVYMLLLSAFTVLLHKYSGQHDIAVGSPLANRTQEELEDMIGFFVNTIVIRSDVGDHTSFREFLQQTKKTTLEAYSHQHAPFEKVVERVVKERDVSRNPLFNVMFALGSMPGVNSDLAIGDLVLSPYTTTAENSHFDLTLTAFEVPGGISYSIGYCVDLFSNERIDRMGSHYKMLLESIAGNISEEIGALPILAQAEKHNLLEAFNATAIGFPLHKTLVDLFEEQVEKAPDHVALVYEGRQMTFRELDERANCLAHHLRNNHAIKGDDLVGIMMGRSSWFVIAALGVLKSGGAYVPIDRNYPQERIRFMLEDSKPELLIIESQTLADAAAYNVPAFAIDKELEELIRRRETIHAPSKIITAANLAYAVYTSGSTGRPKCVMVEHRSVVNVCLEHIQKLSMRPEDRYLLFMSVSFDGAVLDTFSTLLSGASLIIPTPGELSTKESFIDMIGREGITMFTVTPSYLSLLERDLLPTVHTIISAAERIVIGDAMFYAGIKNFYNGYGPSEATVNTTLYKVDPAAVYDSYIPIGKPGFNKEVYILSESGQLCPVGVKGEIHIGGSCLARGYLNNGELTRQKFVPNPFRQGQRMYKTGDLGKWLVDGNIEFVGRKDDQVKIRGYRIELGEIEQAVLKSADIEQGVALITGEPEGDKQIALYYKVAERPEFVPSLGEHDIYDKFIYEAMAHDPMRVNGYREALSKKVKDKVVLDPGTGTELILARYCIECGAKKVYAVEMLEDAYELAKQKIKELDLGSKIELILGDVQDVSLPEPIDYIVSAVAGNIASSDGCIGMINRLKERFGKQVSFVPNHYQTLISAVELPEHVYERGLSEVSEHYAEDVYRKYGSEFDLRMCIRYFPKEQILSDEAVVEDIRYQQEMEEQAEQGAILHIKRDGIFKGLVLWLHAYSDELLMIDSLERTHHLPVYFPVMAQGVKVGKGCQVHLTFIRRTGKDGRHPDYEIKGKVINGSAETAFHYLSPHQPDKLNKSAFHGLLFDQSSGRLRVFEKINAAKLKEHLGRHIPEYMLPHRMIEMASIPLTANGKVDKKALALNRKEHDQDAAYIAPRNETEEMLAAIWRELLGVSKVGVQDNFFALGGDSIITIQLVSRAHKKGLSLSPKDLFEHQTIEKLAKHAGLQKVLKGEQAVLEGEAKLLPIQAHFFEQALTRPSHYNQSVLLNIDKSVTVEWLEQLSLKLVSHHDALRFRYRHTEGGYTQYFGGVENVLFVEHLAENKDKAPLSETIRQICDSCQESLTINEGSLFKMVLILTGSADTSNRLLLLAHHLLVDGVSWRILVEDMERALLQLESKKDIDLGAKTSSYREYGNALSDYSGLRLLEKDVNYWRKIVERSAPLRTDRRMEEKVKMKDAPGYKIKLSKALTDQLLKGVSNVYQTEVNDLLLSALFKTLSVYQGDELVTFGLEGHGREAVMGRELNTSNTVGWFTCLYPVQLRVPAGADDTADLVKSVKEQLRAIPEKGLSYGVLRYMHASEQVRLSLGKKNLFDVVFNYLGQLDNVIAAKSRWFKAAREAAGNDVGDENEFPHKLMINSQVTGGELRMSWTYPASAYKEETIVLLAQAYMKNLEAILAHCREMTENVYTPSDYGLPASVSYNELESFLDSNRPGTNDDMIF